MIIAAALVYQCAWMVCEHSKDRVVVKCSDTVIGTVEQMTEVIKAKWPKFTILHFCGNTERGKK